MLRRFIEERGICEIDIPTNKFKIAFNEIRPESRDVEADNSYSYDHDDYYDDWPD